MKKYCFRFMLLIAFCSFISCKKETTKITKKYNQLEKANWFLGNWENTTPEMQMREIWEQKNDSCFFAESFITVKKDTVFFEYVNLVQRNDSLLYIVSVKDQNKEKPISFGMIYSSDTKLVFENKKHDFPNKITYNKITNDSLLAEVSGIQNGKELKETFPMKKSKTN